MLFRGNHSYKYGNNKKRSLPGYRSTSQNSAPKSFDIDFPGRAAFCISERLRVRRLNNAGSDRSCLATVKKGSLTVEAAFALPLFFLTVVSLIGLMEIYGSFVKEMVSLQQKAEGYAMALIYTGKESNTPVRLYSAVKAEMPFLPFSAGFLKARTGASVLPWTGRSDYESLQVTEESDGQLFFISDYQSVYHTDSTCSYLSLQITAVDSSNAAHEKNSEGDHYQPCEKCIGHGSIAPVVYLTENGEHYHNSPDCSGLKRSVHLVDEEEISGLHMCSRCSKREEQT